MARFCRGFTLTEMDVSGAPKKVAAPISFFYCFTGGMFGSLFVDHGGGWVGEGGGRGHVESSALLSCSTTAARSLLRPFGGVAVFTFGVSTWELGPRGSIMKGF